MLLKLGACAIYTSEEPQVAIVVAPAGKIGPRLYMAKTELVEERDDRY